MSTPDEAALEQALSNLCKAMTSDHLSDSLQGCLLGAAVDDASFAQTFFEQHGSTRLLYAKRAILDEARDTDDAKFAELMRYHRRELQRADAVVEAWEALVALCGGLPDTTAWFAHRYRGNAG